MKSKWLFETASAGIVYDSDEGIAAITKKASGRSGHLQFRRLPSYIASRSPQADL
jgi:hypothetical protein